MKQLLCVITFLFLLNSGDLQSTLLYEEDDRRCSSAEADRSVSHWLEVMSKTLQQPQTSVNCLETRLEDLNKSAAVADCSDAPGFSFNGVYRLSRPGLNTDVYCDYLTPDGPWLVIQRRKDGSVDFYKDWNSYKSGFGNLEGEFWFGNENLYRLTSSGNYALRIDMEAVDGSKAYALYNSFRVSSETDEYRLTLSGYSGTVGDESYGMSYNNGQRFSTYDQDNDAYSGNCAEDRKGAWWYSGCVEVNLNGPYKPGVNFDYKTAHWYSFKNDWQGLKFIEMKIKLMK